jgi:hypothetical protein
LKYRARLKAGSFVHVDATNSLGAPIAWEKSVHTAGRTRAGCENLKAQTIMKHAGVTYSVVAVDEDIVLLRMDFGSMKSYGPGNALVAWEAFKVCGGQIHAV